MKKCRIFKLILFICTVVLFVNGCGAKEEAKDKKIEVYYVKGHYYFDQALNGFKESYKDKYDVQLTGFESDEMMQNQLTTEIAAGKGPDAVLLSSNSDFDIYKAVRSGNIEDLTDYFDKDSTYDPEKYYGSVVNTSKERWGSQYVVPFTFGLDVLYVEEEVWNGVDGNIEALSNYDSYIGLIEKIREYVDKDTLSTYSISPVNTALQIDLAGRYLENSGINIIDPSGKMSEDVEYIADITEFLSGIQQEYLEKQDILAKESQLGGIDKAASISHNGNYPIIQLMVNSIAENVLETQYIDLPWKNTNGLYQPTIIDYGYINETGKNKAGAYALLRYIMDYEIPFGMQYPLSVNRDVVEAELSELETREIETLQMADGSYVYTSLLDEATRNDVEAVLDHMDSAVIYNTGYFDLAVDDIMNEMGNTDMEPMLEDLKSGIDRYLRE